MNSSFGSIVIGSNKVRQFVYQSQIKLRLYVIEFHPPIPRQTLSNPVLEMDARSTIRISLDPIYWIEFGYAIFDPDWIGLDLHVRFWQFLHVEAIAKKKKETKNGMASMQTLPRGLAASLLSPCSYAFLVTRIYYPWQEEFAFLLTRIYYEL